MSNPSRTLAKGRKIANWLAIALVVSVLFNISTPIYYSLQAKLKDKVVVLDLASGSLLLSPLVDPADSKDILNVSTSWAAKAILDRNPAGLDNDELIGILFNSETARKIRDEFATLKAQYLQKSLRSHIEIKAIDSQAVGYGIIKAKVVGQLILYRNSAWNGDSGGAAGYVGVEPRAESRSGSQQALSADVFRLFLHRRGFIGKTMRLTLVLLLLSARLFAQDLSYRVRQEILDQRNPITVNVSTHAVTTLQFPAQIQSLESDGFTQKPNEEAADFYISPGLNWVSIRSLRPGTAQNLGVVIAGRVYEIMIQTTALNDLAVLFRFEQVPPKPANIAPRVWSPLTSNRP